MILQSSHVSDTHRMSHSFSSVNVWISASLLTLLLTVFILLAFSNVTFRTFFRSLFSFWNYCPFSWVVLFLFSLSLGYELMIEQRRLYHLCHTSSGRYHNVWTYVQVYDTLSSGVLMCGGKKSSDDQSLHTGSSGAD